MTRRTEALRALSSMIFAGAALALVGVLVSLGAVASASSSGPDTGNAVISLLGNLVLLVGGCFVLVGIIGHGVRLGIEAARPGPDDRD